MRGSGGQPNGWVHTTHRAERQRAHDIHHTYVAAETVSIFPPSTDSAPEFGVVPCWGAGGGRRTPDGGRPPAGAATTSSHSTSIQHPFNIHSTSQSTSQSTSHPQSGLSIRILSFGRPRSMPPGLGFKNSTFFLPRGPLALNFKSYTITLNLRNHVS